MPVHIPTISQYAATIADPADLTRTLGEFSAERDNYGDVKIRTGNNAAVFRIYRYDGERMLKCYTRPRPDLGDIYRYVSGSGDTLFQRCEYLPAELYVFDAFGKGEYYDVLASEWIDGTTLDTEIKRACREGDKERLSSLSAGFDKLAGELLSRVWAHGDLKPENIIVSPDGSLRLIDFDAIYFPGNCRESFPEVGTPGYQHPARDENLYDKCIDDYPAALISASLKALSLNPALYRKYNRSDIIILNPSEILSGASEAYSEVKKELAGAGCFGHYRLALMLRNAAPPIPGLNDIFARLGAEVSLDGQCEATVENDLWGFTRDGDIVVEPVFGEACPFREGAALVSIEGKKKLIGADGSYLLAGLDYDDIKPVSDGLAAFLQNGKWGYFLADGTVAIEPAYESAGNFHGGYAPVCRDGKWGYIDMEGKSLTGFVYEKAFGFRDGVMKAIKDGEIVKIDIISISKSCK